MNMGNNIMGNYNQGVTERVKCGRCTTFCDVSAGVTLTECNHLFCKNCIKHLFELNTLGFFKCLNPETGNTSRCQKYVTRTAIKEIYSIEDYFSHITESVPVEEKISEYIPSIQKEQSTNNQHDSIQNEQSTNDRHDSVCGNEESTSNKYVSIGQNEQLTNDVCASTRGNEESTRNKYFFPICQIEQLTNDVRESTHGNEESTRNKYYFSTGQNEQMTSDAREFTCGNEEFAINKYYFSTDPNEQLTSDVRESTCRNEELKGNKYYVSTGQNENTKNEEPSFNSENQEPETSRSNAEDVQVLKYKEREEPMSHEPKNYQDATQCRNPECQVWLFYGEEQYSKQFFTCPDCKQRNCFLCKGLHNPAAINCAEYIKTLKNTSEHSEDLLKKMLENNEAMLCPNCKETLLKDNGCDFITCFWCKVELCWVTRGYRWGASGPGDTSGGCRCGVDGIKCHPNCRSCH